MDTPNDARDRNGDDRLPGTQRITLGGEKGYDTSDFVAACRALRITPHLAQNHLRAGGSALDARTARHPGYAISQRIRKRVEEAFGWMKTIGGLRKTRYRGRDRVQMHGGLDCAAARVRTAPTVDVSAAVVKEPHLSSWAQSVTDGLTARVIGYGSIAGRLLKPADAETGIGRATVLL